MMLNAFKEGVIRFRKEIEGFKAGHKMLSVSISTGIDYLPEPFKQFAKIFWDGIEKGDNSPEKMIELLEKIETNNEQSFDKIEGMISELIKSNADYHYIQRIGEIIRTSNESITQILDPLKKEIDLLVKSSQAGDVKPIKNSHDLERCYNVDPTRLVKVREIEFNELKNWVENWDWSTRKGKPILLITGDPGTGKSWLAYRLVYELMKEGYNILRISGPNPHKNIVIDSYKEADNFKNMQKCIFVLDDRGISVGEVSTPINLEDIYEMIKSVTDRDEKFSGPLILSIREETWNHVVNGTLGKERFEEYNLNKLVELKELYALRDEEARKIVESFFGRVDDNQPPYCNLIVSEVVKREVISKSKGNPIVIRLFFEQIYYQSGGKKYELSISDTEGIVGSAKYYCLKQIFYFYLNKMDDRKEMETARVLAFLYFIAKKGLISIGHLKHIKQEKSDYLPGELSKQLDLVNHKTALPLFNINDLGIILSFHDSLTEAIISLAEKPGKLKNPQQIIRKPSEDLKSVMDKISKIADINFRIRIREKSEEDFITKYDKSVTNSIDYYFKKCNYEMEGNDGFIAEDTTSNLLSLFVEFLNRKNEFEVDLEVKRKYIDDFKRLLQKAQMQYNNLELNIDKQLYWIFLRLDWLEQPLLELGKYYIKLLSSKNEEVIFGIWPLTPRLVQHSIVTREEITSMHENFFGILKRSNPTNLQADGIYSLLELSNSDLIKPEEIRQLFLELFHSQDENVRRVTGAFMTVLIMEGSLMLESEYRQEVQGQLFDLVKSSYSNESSLMNSWAPILSYLSILIKTARDMRAEDEEQILDLLKSLYSRLKENTEMNGWLLLLGVLAYSFFADITYSDNLTDDLKHDTNSEDEIFSESLLKLWLSTDGNVRGSISLMMLHSLNTESNPDEVKASLNALNDYLKRVDPNLKNDISDKIKRESQEVKMDLFAVIKDPHVNEITRRNAIYVLDILTQTEIVKIKEVKELLLELFHYEDKKVLMITSL